MNLNVLIIQPDFNSEKIQTPELAYLIGVFEAQKININFIQTFDKGDVEWANKIFISTFLYGHHDFELIEKVIIKTITKIKLFYKGEIWILGKLGRKLKHKTANLFFATDVPAYLPDGLLNMRAEVCEFPYIPNYHSGQEYQISGSIQTLKNNLKSFPILTSVGCHLECSYCVVKESFKPFSFFFLDKILFDMKAQGYNHFVIEDDLFNSDLKHLTSFCDNLIDKNINMSFECLNGLNLPHLNYEILKKLKDAGCVQIALGIETLSPGIYKKIKRERLSLAHLEDIINYCDEIGLGVVGYFITEYSFSKFYLFPLLNIPIVHFTNLDAHAASKIRQILLYFISYISPFRVYKLLKMFGFKRQFVSKVFQRIKLIS